MAKEKYVAVSGLALSPHSLKKLHKHQATLLKPAHMSGGAMEIYVSPMKAKRMATAVRKGKGMKLSLTPDELEHSTKHGKGVVLPSRKIFTPAKEGLPTLAKKGVITHNAPVASLNAGNDTFEVVRGDPVAPSASATPAPKRRGGRKKKVVAEETEGGKIKLKDVGRALKKGFEGYKKYVKPIVGDEIRKGLKTAVKTGVPALASAVLGPEALPVATMLSEKFGDKAIDALGDTTGAFGMGMKPMLNSNYNNFLNPLHPAMNPALPPKDNSSTRGGSFKSAGYGMLRRGRGVASISNIQPMGSAMNPLLPPQDNSIGRGFMSAGY